MRHVKLRKGWLIGGALILVLALLGMMALTGCATDDDAAAPKRVVVTLQTSWGNSLPLDPHGNTGASWAVIAGNVMEGLTRWCFEEEAHVGNIATHWEIAGDWSYVDFYIRDGVYFHNGTPVTPEDVKFSFERAMSDILYDDVQNPYVLRGEIASNVESIEIIEPNIVRLNLTKPYPAVIERSTYIISKAYLEEVGDEEFARNPMGSGPYRIVDWALEDWVLMEKVEDYWGKDIWPVGDFDEIEVVVLTEMATRLAVLQSGEHHVAGGLSGAMMPTLHSDPNLEPSIVPGAFLMSLVINELLDPNSIWSDRRVVKAMSLSLDREGLCKNVLNDAHTPWNGFLSPFMPGYRYREPDPFDQAEAIRLLGEVADERGLSWNPDGPPYGWENWAWGDITWEPALAVVFDALVANLHDVGIMVNPVQMEHGIWSQRHMAGELKGISYGPGPWWAGSAHPAVGCWSHTVGSWAPVGRQFPELHEAFGKMLWATDEAELAAAAQAFDDLCVELGFRIPVYHNHGIHAYRSDVVESLTPLPGTVFAYDAWRLRSAK